MDKLDLNMVAGEFEIISSDTHLFYNTETGEFDFFGDFMDAEVADSEKFEEDCWVPCPSQRDIGEYDIMVDFAGMITDSRANELLSVALEGRGAFRRFKDTLYRIGLVDRWYAFKRDAFVNLARDWCEENDIPYEDANPKEEPPLCAVDKSSLNMVIMPLPANASGDAVEALCDALCYSRSAAEQEVRKMMKRQNICLAAIADNRVVGIIGAIPQYGVTGWELHPLAVLKEYQRRGIGSALVEALESEVAGRGGVMLYLGSDDETGTTSLYGTDLYDDTFSKIKNIQMRTASENRIFGWQRECEVCLFLQNLL